MPRVQPPIAEQRPHVWDRPTGPTDDHYAWLRDRDDPATVAYLTAENAYCEDWFAPHADLRDAIFEEIRSRVQETDESVPVRKGEWWYLTRTVEFWISFSSVFPVTVNISKIHLL